MSTQQTLAQVYLSTNLGIGDIDALNDALQAWYQNWPEHHFLHPCIIDAKPSLVCRAELSHLEPAAFAELQNIADRYGVYLKQDRRQSNGEHNCANRRQNAGLLLVFCMGMLASSKIVTAHDLHTATAVSAGSRYEMPITNLQASSVTMSDGSKAIRLQRAKPPSAKQVLAAYQSEPILNSVNSDQHTVIVDFLKRTYQVQTSDPENIEADLQQIADYYAGYPQAVTLIESLAKHNVILKYRQGTWQAQAWGEKHRVDSVIIHFDTRAGAQLLDGPDCQANPACSISAADALLHELLHARLMLLESERFIAEGGMQENIYPYNHEQEVLALENQLYHSMNRQDGRSRPLRQRHTGSLQEVICAVCTPGVQIASSENE